MHRIAFSLAVAFMVVFAAAGPGRAHHSEARVMIEQLVPGMIRSTMAPLANMIAALDQQIASLNRDVVTLRADVDRLGQGGDDDEMTFRGQRLRPDRFYIFSKNYQAPVSVYNMDIVAETPLYAYVGNDLNVKARVIAVLTPRDILIHNQTPSAVIVLVNGLSGQKPTPDMTHMMVTRRYRLATIDAGAANSTWRVRNALGETETLHKLISVPTNSVHDHFWRLNVSSADIPAFINQGGGRLHLSGLMIPAFLTEQDLDAFNRINVTGWRPGADETVKLIQAGQPILKDPAFMTMP